MSKLRTFETCGKLEWGIFRLKNKKKIKIKMGGEIDTVNRHFWGRRRIFFFPVFCLLFSWRFEFHVVSFLLSFSFSVSFSIDHDKPIGPKEKSSSPSNSIFIDTHASFFLSPSAICTPVPTLHHNIFIGDIKMR